MRLFRRTILAATCLACISGFAAADDDVCPAPIDVPSVPATLIRDLAGWIALSTMYDVSGLLADPPQISFCRVGDVISYEGSDLRVEKEIRAAYSLPDRVIHLVEPWSPDNPYDRSVLLHELIHVVQLDTRDWPCTGAPEIEAYMLQAEYLSGYGIDPGFDWRSIFLLSICPEN